MTQVQSIFPIHNDGETYLQKLARTKLRMITSIARQLSLPFGNIAHLQGSEMEGIDVKIQLKAKTFSLDWGIDNWDFEERERLGVEKWLQRADLTEKRKEPPPLLVGWTLRFNEDLITVIWSRDDGWEASVHANSERPIAAARVLGLAYELGITCLPWTVQLLMQQEAQTIIERGFRYYRDNMNK